MLYRYNVNGMPTENKSKDYVAAGVKVPTASLTGGQRSSPVRLI